MIFSVSDDGDDDGEENDDAGKNDNNEMIINRSSGCQHFQAPLPQRTFQKMKIRIILLE